MAVTGRADVGSGGGRKRTQAGMVDQCGAGGT
jgi:hypothetical protein